MEEADSLLAYVRSQTEVFTEPLTDQQQQSVKWLSIGINSDQPMTVWIENRTLAQAIAAAALRWAERHGLAAGLTVVEGAGNGFCAGMHGSNIVVFRRTANTIINSKVRGEVSYAYELLPA